MLPAHVAEQALDEMHLGARHTYTKNATFPTPLSSRFRLCHAPAPPRVCRSLLSLPSRCIPHLFLALFKAMTLKQP